MRTPHGSPAASLYAVTRRCTFDDMPHGDVIEIAAEDRRDLKRAFALIAAAAAVAQTRLAEQPDVVALDALSISMRGIDNHESAVTARLNCPEAVIAASAARRCVVESRKTLASLHRERL
jgi:hypothetical protein